jgi:Amt family ammonium transporter
MTAGYSALVVALLLNKRRGFESVESRPHDTGMILLGTALLWFGWFGFNAGSALGANGVAVQAFATTFFASAASMLSWTCLDWSLKGKPSAIGASIGAVAGLATITPAAGYVSVGAAIVIGFLAGLICNGAVLFFKNKCKIDDTLDVFGCHGIGGTLGILMTGVFATKAVNPAGADGLLQGNFSFFGVQCLSAFAVALFSVGATFVIIKVMSTMTAFCVEADEEHSGLDLSQHSECISSLV